LHSQVNDTTDTGLDRTKNWIPTTGMANNFIVTPFFWLVNVKVPKVA
jgi:hypothetical protein